MITQRVKIIEFSSRDRGQGLIPHCLCVLLEGGLAGCKFWLPEANLKDLTYHTAFYNKYAPNFLELDALEKMALITELHKKRLLNRNEKAIKCTPAKTNRVTDLAKDLKNQMSNNPNFISELRDLVAG